jgi:ABC-type transporter Mla MlaB component
LAPAIRSLAPPYLLLVEQPKGAPPLVAPEQPPTPSSSIRPPREGTSLVFDVSGRLDRAGIPALCQQVGAMLDGHDAEPLVCDVAAIRMPDAVTVDALARIQLTARRHGRRITLRDASRELQELLDLMGLGDVIPCGEGSGIEATRQTEEREQGGSVEEEGDPADRSV